MKPMVRSLVAAAALGSSFVLGMAAPVAAQAQTSADVIRSIVTLADVVFRNGQPYYRNSQEQLVVGRDAYGRTVYYRVNPYGDNSYYGTRTYGNTTYQYGTYGNGSYGYDPYQGTYNGTTYPQRTGTTRCTSNGWCTTTYYDPSYDRTRNRYSY